MDQTLGKAGGGIFNGLRFRLVGFDTATDEKYRVSIKAEGGLIERQYIFKDLYLVAFSETTIFSDQVCSDAYEKGALLLNELWLEDSLDQGVAVDVTKILYRPPISLGGIKGATYLKIACSGFSVEESSYVQKLIEMTGAEKDEITKCSYLICNRAEGKDYENATERRIFTVNKYWLEECVLKWEIVSVDKHIIERKRENTRGHQKHRKEATHSNRDRTSWSTGRKPNAHSGGYRGSPEQTNIYRNKRQAISTGSKKPQAPVREPSFTSCRRRLNFNLKRLSDYDARDLVMTVQIPRSRMQMDVGTDLIKRSLLGSYTALSNIHSGGQCVRNAFDAVNFVLSTQSEQVTMEDVQLIDYNDKIAGENKEEFVRMVKKFFKEKLCSIPEDISIWLDCISARVPDPVLKNHVNLKHGIDIFSSFIAMYYIVYRLKDKPEDWPRYKQIVKSDRLDRYKLWEDNDFYWELLHRTLKYVHPNQVELHALKNKEDGSISEPKKREDTVFGLIEVIRDCVVHPGMHYQELLLPTLMTQYPRLLSDLQQTLFEFGHLKNLR